MIKTTFLKMEKLIIKHTPNPATNIPVHCNSEPNRSESQKIEIVTSFGVAQRDIYIYFFFPDAPACIGLSLSMLM